MVVEYIRYLIPENQHADFVEAYTKAATALDSSGYCLGYELSQCEEEPNRFILRIEWTSTDDHMKRFRGSDDFRAFLPHIRPYINHIEEMQHYHHSSVSSRR